MCIFSESSNSDYFGGRVNIYFSRYLCFNTLIRNCFLKVCLLTHALFLFFSSSFSSLSTSASSDAPPKEDKVVRIHAFFFIICFYNAVNFMKWMFHLVLLVTIFHKEIICWEKLIPMSHGKKYNKMNI